MADRRHLHPTRAEVRGHRQGRCRGAVPRGLVCAAVLLAAPAARAACLQIDDRAPVTIATATGADEYALTIDLESASATSWGEAGNEALVLEISGAKRGLIGHLILHQGKTKFDYTMHVGALAAGEALQARVSPLSAPKAKHEATACTVSLVAASTLGDAAEGVRNAPEFRWPVQKSFNDVPLVVGWSKSHKSYETVMTNEDGGTAENCGGGAAGMQAEIARWGRSTDIEDHYHYGAHPTWERCVGGRAEASMLHMEAAHPILYEGSGHNRLFESRGGYGQACGKKKPEKPDGDLDGWNVHNPGNQLENDAGRVIILRPLPVDLDALGYAKSGGRREAIAEHYAPWMYRLSALELAREGKIDNTRTFGMERYLYVDVAVANVGGHGDSYCAPIVRGGFKLRAVAKNGKAASSPQITKAYAGDGWKRVAIALPGDLKPSDIDHFVIDAYDKDGLYVNGIGDAFVPRADGDNGAKLDYIRQGTQAFTYYVDDDRSGCVKGTNTLAGVAYQCVGGQADLQ